MGGAISTEEPLAEGPPQTQIITYTNYISSCAADPGDIDAVCEKKCAKYLGEIINIASVPTQLGLSHAEADALGYAILSISKKRPTIYPRLINTADETRSYLTPHITMGDKHISPLPHNILSILENEDWIPRSVRCIENGFNIIGTTVDIGLTSPSAITRGFCIECWVRLTKGSGCNMITTTGTNGKLGSCPHFSIQNNRLIFGLSGNDGGKIIQTGPVNFSGWVHVSVIAGSGTIRLFVQGKSTASVAFKKRITGVTLTSVAAAQPNCTSEMCELRIWACERTDNELLSTMCVSIPPSKVDDYPDLRLSWFPSRRGGRVHAAGAVLFDAWQRCPIGSRMSVSYPSSIPDSRWICTIPPAFKPNTDPLWMCDFQQELSEWREQAEMKRTSVLPSSVPPIKFSAFDINATRLAKAMIEKEPALWYPRIVSLPPGMVASIGASDALGLTGAKGFTIETWIYIRTSVVKGLSAVDSSTSILRGNSGSFLLSGKAPASSPVTRENTVIGYGIGAPFIPGNCLQLTLKNMRPYIGFHHSGLSSTIPLTPMKWYHLAAVYGGGSQQIFVNGTLVVQKYCPALSGSCPLTIGGFWNDSRPLAGDLCEMRVWTRPLRADEIKSRMYTSIPPNKAESYADLRLSWLPLRFGGPYSHNMWSRTIAALENKTIKHSKNPVSLKNVRRSSHLNSVQPDPPVRQIPSQPSDLIYPAATLLWDVVEKRDCGTLPGNTVLPASRSRFAMILGMCDSLKPAEEFIPLLQLVDEWSDAYDREFMTSCWPTPTTPIGMMEGESWIPRVFLNGDTDSHPYSILGTTAELGLEEIGNSVGFTLELWLKPHGKVSQTYQNILGHEDKISNKGTGMLGVGKPNALRLGILQRYVYISLRGEATKNKSDLIYSNEVLRSEEWTHIAFICSPNNVWQIIMNGTVTAERPMGSTRLDAPSGANLHIFGHPGRELRSDICEMRLWSKARSLTEIRSNMHRGMLPISPDGPPLPNLRLAWLPLRRTNTLLVDIRNSVLRGSTSSPRFSRRPHLLPTLIQTVLQCLPRLSVMDDETDAFETYFLPTVCSSLQSNGQSDALWRESQIQTATPTRAQVAPVSTSQTSLSGALPLPTVLLPSPTEARLRGDDSMFQISSTTEVGESSATSGWGVRTGAHWTRLGYIRHYQSYHVRAINQYKSEVNNERRLRETSNAVAINFMENAMKTDTMLDVSIDEDNIYDFEMEFGLNRMFSGEDPDVDVDDNEWGGNAVDIRIDGEGGSGRGNSSTERGSFI